MIDPLILAGLESHGFREDRAGADDLAGPMPRRFRRLGRADRLLHPDGSITVEGLGLIPEGSDYHALLRKCGGIILRTRERYPLQAKLALGGDDYLDQLN